VALAALQADLPPIKRTSRGQVGTRNFRYPEYPKILRAVRPILAKHGFVWSTQPELIDKCGELRFVLTYTLWHLPSQDQLSGQYPLAEGPAQQQGAQIAYAKRYALVAVLDLEVEGEDTDAMDTPTRRPVRGAKVTGPDHERLRHGTHEPTPEDRPADRGPLPLEQDVWQDQPAGLLPTGDPEDRPGSITKFQRAAMHAAFGQAGISDRDVRLGWTREALNLPDLASSNDLSYAQAARLLQLLHEAAGVREGR
jgi:hypothetical protein